MASDIEDSKAHEAIRAVALARGARKAAVLAPRRDRERPSPPGACHERHSREGSNKSHGRFRQRAPPTRLHWTAPKAEGWPTGKPCRPRRGRRGRPGYAVDTSAGNKRRRRRVMAPRTGSQSRPRGGQRPRWSRWWQRRGDESGGRAANGGVMALKAGGMARQRRVVQGWSGADSCVAVSNARLGARNPRRGRQGQRCTNSRNAESTRAGRQR